MSLRQQAWGVLQARRGVTLNELLASIDSGARKNAPVHLYAYLNALVRVGYLEKKPAKGLGQPRFLLLVDHGNKAPRWHRRLQEVYDPNTGAVISLREAGEKA